MSNAQHATGAHRLTSRSFGMPCQAFWHKSPAQQALQMSESSSIWRLYAACPLPRACFIYELDSTAEAAPKVHQMLQNESHSMLNVEHIAYQQAAHLVLIQTPAAVQRRLRHCCSSMHRCCSTGCAKWRSLSTAWRRAGRPACQATCRPTVPCRGTLQRDTNAE